MKNQEIVDLLHSEFSQGNIVLNTFEGLAKVPFSEWLKQPADGLLYDLNRGEEVSMLFAKQDDGEKWINDFAVAKVIRELKKQVDELTANQKTNS